MSNTQHEDAGAAQQRACAAIVSRIDERMAALKIRSDSEVGKLAGIALDAVRNIRRGKFPRMDRVFALARALQCDPNWLAYGVTKETLAFDEQRMFDVVTYLLKTGVQNRVSPEVFAEWMIIIYGEGRGPLTAAERDDLAPRISRAFRLARD